MAKTEVCFASVKSQKIKNAAIVFLIREFLIFRCIQIINALRVHLAEFDQVLQQRAANTLKLVAILNDLDAVFLCGWE